MDDEPLPRRERQKVQHRQEMLAAALELFAKRGFHNVSMHEIAEKSEFAIGTLYKFFANKEDLYRALVLDQSEVFHRGIVEAFGRSEDEVEQLRDYVRTKGDVTAKNLPFVRLFLAESKGASYNIKAGLDEELRERYNETLDMLASVFDAGFKSKRFKEIATAYQLANALDSVINAFLLLSIESPENHPYPENPDIILNIFFRGLLDS